MPAYRTRLELADSLTLFAGLFQPVGNMGARHAIGGFVTAIILLIFASAAVLHSTRAFFCRSLFVPPFWEGQI